MDKVLITLRVNDDAAGACGSYLWRHRGAMCRLPFGSRHGASATATPPKPVEHSVFLCYSTYQVEPGVWKLSQAETLFKAGYWQPFAVAGNVDGATNVGKYHLVCNLATGQSVPAVHGYVGGGGTVVGADMHKALETNLAFYPIVG